jgi:hypothetical protein
MDKMEEALKEVLELEEARISKKITCFITHEPCKRCQPYCTHRQKEECRLKVSK